ncbi:MAG TPA: MarR family transcriptional regulator [Pseudonocardiaceae bacterium]|nr:MarR family transcriptional regulator [Pseudonocardiaceae bacterium]
MSGPESEQLESAQRRDVVIERFATLGRQLSQATVLFHEQIAEHVGLSATDHKCLDLAVQAERPLTAGQIAELSGLSTGAVTGVIDRLERAGFVRRVRDPHDRRKVLVEVSRGSLAKYGNAYDGLWSALDSALTGYTEGELVAIERFVQTMVQTLRGESEKLAAMRGATR